MYLTISLYGILVIILVGREFPIYNIKTHDYQNPESTEGYSESIVRKKDWSQQVEHMQVLKGTGPGARRSKRPLSACHTHRKCSIETTQNSVKGRFRYKV